MKFLFTLLLSFSFSIIYSQGSGDCIDFDGTNDHIHVTDNQAYAGAASDFTIECWVNTSDGTGTNMAFVTNYGGTGQTPFFMLGFDGSNAFFWCRDGSGTSTKPTTTRANVVDGTWHHFAGVRSSAGTFLYVDGMLVGSVAPMTNACQFGTTLSIMDHYNRFTSGQIDEIRIWSEARSQDDIRNYMCKKLEGTETNLYHYFRMDGATTAANGVTDLAGTANGTMINMAAGDVVTSGAPVGDESIWLYPGDWTENGLDFDGTNDYVNVGDVIVDGSSEITVEAWINPSSLPVKASPSGHNSNEGAVVHKSGGSDDNLGLTVATGATAFYLDLGSDFTLQGSTVSTGVWTHLAATYDGTTMRLYINGVLDNTLAATGNIINNTNSLRFGGGHVGGGSPFEFTGQIDEVRIWNRALTIGEINNNMCRTLLGTETGLQGYWKLNDGTGSATAIDDAGGNNGTLTNMDAATDWVTTGVVCNWAGSSLTLESFENDSLMVSTVAGNPDGVQIYHVQELPNTLVGTNGVSGDNDHYYGVYKTGGAAPTYTATYFYSDNDAYLASDPSINEADLVMYKRDDNADATWANSGGTVNTGAKTITALGESTEYILGILGGSPLPVELLSFTATRVDKKVDLNWITASEINNDYFILERSTDGQAFKRLALVDGAGNSSQTIHYSYSDNAPDNGWNYYRLIQVDFDGTETRSDIEQVYFSSEMQAVLYPNPNNQNFTKIQLSENTNVKVDVIDGLGRVVCSEEVSNESGELRINHGKLAPGKYLVRIFSSNRSESLPLIVLE